MIWIILAALCSAIMDLVSSKDRFAKYGIWFSREGYILKYDLMDWLNKFMPEQLAKFLAFDVMVIFTDLFHTSKTLMVAFFCIAAFSLTSQAFLAWLVFGVMFNFFYYLIK
jgi:hypothetical protein